MICGKCKHQKECLEGFAEERGCLNGFEPKKTTKFDKVTETPETLAKFIVEDAQYVGLCSFKQSPDCCSETTCEECIKAWLNKEVGEDSESDEILRQVSSTETA